MQSLPLTDMRYTNGRVVSLPLTDMRYTNGRVENSSPSPQGGGFFCKGDRTMKKAGFYIIRDQFFTDMADPYLKGNKGENRPHYYCFEDTRNGIYWMIPLSSRIEKYQKIIEKWESKGKSCDILHIATLDNGKKSAFLLQDMFPMTDEYVEREYTVAGNHLMVTSEKTIRIIEKKARKVVGMLKRGVKFTPTQPDVIAILKKLQQEAVLI